MMLRATAVVTAALVFGWVVVNVASLALPPPSKLVEPSVHVHSRRSFGTSAAVAAVATTVFVGTSQFQNQAAAALEQQLPLTTVGAKAPTFDLPNSRGTGNTSLAQLTAGKKWTVLYFYPGAFTQGCTLEARAFQRDIDEYRQRGAQIVGVSVDPPEKNAQFCSAEGLDFYLLSDTGTYMWRW
jgi:peroxiredoxin